MPARASWTNRDVIRVAAIVIAVFAVAQLLWIARALVLTALLGIFFAIAVSAGVDRLERIRVPRPVGAPLIVFGVLALLAGFAFWMGPTVRTQSIELRERLPEAIDKLEVWIEQRGDGILPTVLGLEDVHDPAAAVPDAIDEPAAVPPDATPDREVRIPGVNDQPERVPLRDRLKEQLAGASRYFLPFIGQTLLFLAGVVLVIFLSIYLAVNPGVYRRGVLFFVRKERRARAERILHEVAVMMQRWLVVEFILMVVVGVAATAVLLALRVPAAVPLGILAGLLEFIPNIGPILSALPAIAMGLVDSPQKAAAVALAYMVIQFLENQVLIPVIMQEGVKLPPALTLVIQAAMAIAFGFLGLLLAVPITAAAVVAIRTARALDEGTMAESPSGR